jgi:hypothetical protein
VDCRDCPLRFSLQCLVGSCVGEDIFVSAISSFCPTSADGLHSLVPPTRWLPRGLLPKTISKIQTVNVQPSVGARRGSQAAASSASSDSVGVRISSRVVVFPISPGVLAHCRMAQAIRPNLFRKTMSFAAAPAAGQQQVTTVLYGP